MKTQPETQLSDDLQQIVASQPFAPDVAAIERRGRQLRRRSVAARGAAGLGVAAGITAVALAVSTAQPGAARPGRAQAPSVAAPAVRLASATVVLDKAAVAVAVAGAGHSFVMPGPHQWIYEKGIKKSPVGVITMESWTRFDGERSADIENGKLKVLPFGSAQDGDPLATPEGAARYLSSLPAQPRALLAAIYKKDKAEPRSQWYVNLYATAFSDLMELQANATGAVPPKVQADVFRALALIPGIRDIKTTDMLGRPAIGITVPAINGYFLLDPTTYGLIGLSYQGSGITHITDAVVSGPGQR
jgi:hypothetical protein